MGIFGFFEYNTNIIVWIIFGFYILIIFYRNI